MPEMAKGGIRNADTGFNSHKTDGSARAAVYLAVTLSSSVSAQLLVDELQGA
jgi:hypothetical protein